jgi:transposase
LPGTPAAMVIADKAYDAQQRVIQPLQNAGKGGVILAKRCRRELRECDKHLYRARHLIEQFFNKLKQYRSIATRYDKTSCNFLGAIYLAAAVIWLN